MEKMKSFIHNRLDSCSGSTNGSIATIRQTRLKYNPSATYYDTSGFKHLYIFHHTNFQKQRTGSSSRTKSDVENLGSTFGKLDFNVTTYEELSYDEITDNVQLIKNMDHRNTSCIAVAILTRDTKRGDACAADKSYPISDVIDSLMHAPSLARKPKIFLIQVCKRGNVDHGIRVEVCRRTRKYITIPTHADSFVMYAGTPGNQGNIPNQNSSCSSIQILCEVMSKYHHTLNLLQMRTVMNMEVVNDRKQYCNELKNPDTQSTLTKLLKF